MSLKDLEKEFYISAARMRRIARDFQAEMARGLAGQKSSLKMLPAYVRRSTGDERGEFLALDLGGSNFRILKLELKGAGRIGMSRVKEFPLKRGYINADAERLFGFLSDCVKDFLKATGAADRGILDAGFTFSFPVRQTDIASGMLISWTKGFDAKGVVGKDVVKLLQDSLAKRGVNGVRVTALANDTVGTLMAASYEDPDCDIGVIIGTGTNACYVEKDRGIINIEWGNFNKLKSTVYDKEIDRDSDSPGEQILEKAVSGMYLGGISRLALADLLKRNELKKTDFKTEYMSAIESDSSAGLSKIDEVLKKLGVMPSSLKERRAVKRVCELVSRRASRISAAALAAVLKKMDPDLSKKHTVAIDGSVYEKHPYFQESMRSAIKDIFGNRSSKIKILLTKDGSGRGAAVIAAVAAKGYRYN